MSLIQQLADEMQISPGVLINAMSIGLRQSQLDALHAIIAQARQLHEQKQAAEQAEIDALTLPIMEARSRRANLVAGLEAHWAETHAAPTSTVVVPVWADLQTQLEGE